MDQQSDKNQVQEGLEQTTDSPKLGSDVSGVRSGGSKLLPGRSKSGYFVTAVIFTIVGVILASNLDFSSHSVAQKRHQEYSANSGEYSSPFVAVIEKYADAVVAVTSERQTDPDGFFGMFSRKTSRRPVKSSGSGFFFREDGYILTNNHVVEGADVVKVRTASGFTYDAILVGADPGSDLAVIKVDTDDPIVTIPLGNSDEIRVGDWAIAIGNPFPQQGLDRSVSVGIISAKGRSSLRFSDEGPAYQDFIQTDAAINPGNSGGPLLNIKGEAIGINSSIFSPSGGSVGIGFSIPSNLAKAIVPDLIAYGEAKRGWLGIQMAGVTVRDAKAADLEEVKGVVVEKIVPDSPAERSGLQRYDIIFSYNNHDVIDPSQLSVLVSTTRKGSSVPIEVIRGDKRIKLTAEIGDREIGVLASSELDQSDNEKYFWLGMELITSTRTNARRYGIEYTPGLLVLRVERRSPAFKAGFTFGDVITEIGNQKVASPDDLELALSHVSKRAKTISLIVVDKYGDIEYRTIQT